MHVLLPAADSLDHLRAEWSRAFTDRPLELHSAGLCLAKSPAPDPDPLPSLTFARQVLPDATFVSAASIRAFADQLFTAIVPAFPDDRPWRLHIEPHFGQGTAGRHRCQLIREALAERLQRQRRHLLRRCQPLDHVRPFADDESFAQLLLTAPDQGFLSVAPAPVPMRHRAVLSPFPKGEIPVASDKAAPCRAFAKLVEAELRLGRPIAPGETCVDLGASPGSWSYVALQRGARVTAVDRSPLRVDLMNDRRLTFHQGDAFGFVPDRPVDWLLCDVIAAPDRSIALVLDWVRHRRCRHFVVTLKFKGTTDYPALDRLKAEMPPFATDWLLTRLCANKNEACVLGHVAEHSNP